MLPDRGKAKGKAWAPAAERAALRYLMERVEGFLHVLREFFVASRRDTAA